MFFRYEADAMRCEFSQLKRNLDSFINKINDLLWADGVPRIENRNDPRVRDFLREHHRRYIFNVNVNRFVKDFWDFYDENPISYWSRWRLGCQPSYVKQPHHVKKVKTDEDLARQEWRKRKNDRRIPHWGTAGRSWAKRASNSWRRAWERGRIAQEDWESMYLTEDKSFCDNRLWD